MNIIITNMNKMNIDIVIAIVSNIRNNGETIERGVQEFIRNHALDKIRNPSEVLLASL